MEARSLKFVTAAVGGELLAGAPETMVCRVNTDSRQTRPGDLYFALKGERFDGHDFLAAVTAAGATAVVCARDRVPAPLPACGVIAVACPRAALGQLAAAYRAEFDLPVVAVGGSNGKTTTKELLAAVLRQRGPTLWSEASFNNDIGVPLTLLRLEAAHWAAVVETGTNHPGELAPLLRLAQPRYGVLTNIGREHLEFFGNLAGVAEEEGALATALPADGKLFLNGDDAWADKIAARSPAPVVRVGLDRNNAWCAHAVRLLPEGMQFQVTAPQAAWSGEYRIRLLGRHQVTNALLALAVGAELGLTPDQVRDGFAEARPAKMRLELWDAGGVKVLDDSYNANADSVRAALQLLSELPCAGRRLAVLGDMEELGTHSAAAHAEAGRLAAEWGVSQLLAVGRMAGVMAAAAREAGLTRVLEFAEVEAAAPALKALARSGDVVLLKASRATRIERVVAGWRPAAGGK